MTQQSKLISTFIIVLALAAIGIFFLVEWFEVYTIPTREEEPVHLRVLVAPELAPWVQEQARDFESRQRGVILTIVTLDGARADAALAAAGDIMADVWIPEASFVPYLYQSPPFESTGTSVAHSGLNWVDPRGDTPTGWENVHDLAVNDLRFQLALPPRGTIARLAACGAAARAFTGVTELTFATASARDLQTWMSDFEDAVPNPGRSPLSQLTTRPVTIDLALMPAYDRAGLPPGQITTPLSGGADFDYPYFIRQRWPGLGEEATNARRAAATSFQDYLLSANPQAALAAAGFDTPGGAGSPLTADGVRGLQWCWE